MITDPQRNSCKQTGFFYPRRSHIVTAVSLADFILMTVAAMAK